MADVSQGEADKTRRGGRAAIRITRTRFDDKTTYLHDELDALSFVAGFSRLSPWREPRRPRHVDGSVVRQIVGSRTPRLTWWGNRRWEGSGVGDGHGNGGSYRGVADANGVCGGHC